jgi:hypothetical protein
MTTVNITCTVNPCNVATTVELVPASMVDPDIIQAEATIFLATLVAGCVVYGLKAVYRLFTTHQSE